MNPKPIKSIPHDKWVYAWHIERKLWIPVCVTFDGNNLRFNLFNRSEGNEWYPQLCFSHWVEKFPSPSSKIWKSINEKESK